MTPASIGVGRPLPPYLEARIVEDMEALHIDRAFIYAFQHTGLLVTDVTIDRYTDAQLLAWQDAVDRFRRLERTTR